MNPHWTQKKMRKLAKDLGLQKSQVYKWNWEKKKLIKKLCGYDLQVTRGPFKVEKVCKYENKETDGDQENKTYFKVTKVE